MRCGPAFFGSAASAPTYLSRLHFEGTNASTTFTDETGKTWTAGGGAQISTAQAALGSASGLFNGTDSYISTPHHADFNFGTGGFSIKWRMRFASKTGFQTILTRAYGADGGILIQTGNGDGKVVCYVWSAGPTLGTVQSDTGSTVNQDQWYQMEWLRVGSSNVLRRDGVQVGSGTNSQNIAPAGTPALYLGAGNGADPPTGFWFNGYLDEFSIS